MAIKLLENAGIENTGIGASALNNLITGNKSGIVGKYLNECAFTTTGNTIIIDKGLLIICGRQVELDAIESITLSSLPSEDVRYQIVIELIREESGEVTASIFARQPSTLIQENLLKDGFVYQFELGRVTHKTTGQVTEVLRTADILYGQSGAGADIEVGEVNTQMISTELPAEVNINKIIDSGKTKLNFDFSLPKPYEDSVTGIVYSSQIVGESVTINNTADGYIDQITLEGNTIGGGGTPETPIAIQSVESPVNLTVCGKNTYKMSSVAFCSNSTGAIIDNNNITLTSTTDTPDTKYCYIKNENLTAGTYYFSFTKGSVASDVRIYGQNAGNTGVSLGGGVNGTALTAQMTESGVVTIPSGYVAYYFLFYIQNATPIGQTGTFSNIQLELGTTATEFEAYQCTTHSIPLKDIDSNALTLRRAGTAYDSVYKESGKWYLRKSINEQVLNGSEDWHVADSEFGFGITDAKWLIDAGALANLIATTHQTRTYNQILFGDNGVWLLVSNFSIRDTVTFAGFTLADFKTWLSTHNITIAYELATPEIIELHEDTATALESLKTHQGTTNIFGTNTVNPILDVTELAMGVGEKKYALLTDGDGNAVMPVNEADNVILRDGKTVEYAISQMLLRAHPVGSIYMSIDNTAPSTLFGGTWVRLKDRFLLGAGDTYINGATGGAATHTLTVAEMPRHNHAVLMKNDDATIFDNIQLGTTGDTFRFTSTGDTGMQNNGDGSGFNGDGAAHNNMPPYLTVYMWKRTA